MNRKAGARTVARREGTETMVLAVIMAVGVAGAVKVVEVAELVSAVLIQDQDSL
jgi:uncharacterized protein (DUF2336 family)